MFAQRTICAVVLVWLLVLARLSFAYSTGITGYSGKQRVICTQCHSGGDRPSVSFSGPTVVDPGNTQTYVFMVHSANIGKQTAAGFNVAASDGTLKTAPGQQERVVGGELEHIRPQRNDAGGNATWEFKWQAPTTPGNYILWGAGNSVNLDGTNSGDNAEATMLFVAVGGVPTITPTVAPDSPTPPAPATSTPTAVPASPSPTSTDLPSPLPTFAPTATETPPPVATTTDTPTPTAVPTQPPTFSSTPTVTASPDPTVPDDALPGDANCDETRSAADLVALVEAITAGEPGSCGADADGSGSVGEDDLLATSALIYEPSP